jgi:flavin reductase (DIM6/NTAB) family NADH-FMN oxidoreductase RutF
MIPIVRLSDSTYSSTQVLTYKLHLLLLLYYVTGTVATRARRWLNHAAVPTGLNPAAYGVSAASRSMPRPSKAEGTKRKRLVGEAGPADTANAVPESYEYAASPAEDGRSKCKGCRAKIEIGETRIGRLTKSRQQEGTVGARQLTWYGTECGCIGHKALKDLYSTSQIYGFRALPEDEQTDLEACLAAASITHVKEKQMLSRLLYPNPVCMLTTPAHVSTGRPNVMTISWLTPLNNFGLILLSVNAKRHTASKLQACPDFVLNIPAHGFEETVLAIGKNTGGDGDKFAKLSIEKCAPGWEPLAAAGGGEDDTPEAEMDDGDATAAAGPPETAAGLSSVQNPFALLGQEDESESESESEAEQQEATHAKGKDKGKGKGKDKDKAEGKGEDKNSTDPTRSGGLVAIAGAVCHIVCKVRSMTEEDGHWLVHAEMSEAFVQRRYWNGKQLCARDASVPPFLTFLGSQTFGYVVSEPLVVPAAAESEEDEEEEEEEEEEDEQEEDEQGQQKLKDHSEHEGDERNDM